MKDNSRETASKVRERIKDASTLSPYISKEVMGDSIVEPKL